ncbi:Inherit from euNOG: MYND finger [Seminavis robusta]|uniref:Inherit from euNOG: MYND finger n=1 Tax=Seminavis robusta TaxID=568900 RepID=A0A9N8DUS6_9STRA|nr:Inherit from euNOG: MYND finger [Seminavis robusta]|eukprot:Sro374_g129200.1 Inherit from euNOG: MYND finger (496) ;mRNA; f:13878-15365
MSATAAIVTQGSEIPDGVGIWSPQWFEMMKNGPWFRREEMQPINPRFQNYHPYACHSCKRGSLMGSNLLTCTRCNVVRYCSKDCQKCDWKFHKQWCKAFHSLCQDGLLNQIVKYDSIEAWQNDSPNVLSLLFSRMGEGILRHSVEIQITLSQPRCRKCFQAGFTLLEEHGNKAQKANLTPCPICMGVTLCDECLQGKDVENMTMEENSALFHSHRCKNPMQECHSHLLSLCCAGMIVEQEHPLGMPSDTDSQERWVPRSWREYFDKKRSDFDLPEQMFLLAPVPVFLSEAHSINLTLQYILFGLSLPEFAALREQEKLVIHYCGASASELNMPGKYVELVRLNPHWTELQLHFIGPNQPDGVASKLQRAIGMESIRPTCNIKVHAHKGLYHDLHLDPPTLIVCQSSGLSDPGYTQEWRPTVEHFFHQSSVPVVWTAGLEKEIMDDCQVLRSWGAHLLVEPTANPFRGLWPLLDPGRECGDFFYSNSYFAVMKGQR